MATLNTSSGAKPHAVVSHAEWTEARRRLLVKEKEFTRLRDQLNEQRRALPWERVEKAYAFDAPSGKATLADLFDGRKQLVVWHFMFGADWQQGCSHCAFWADGWNGVVEHLKHRDTTLIAISQAPLAKIEAFRKRMGWTFKWVSAANTDFNFDFQASARPEELKAGRVLYNYETVEPFSDQMHGCSAFYRDGDGAIYHTYSTYARGVDTLNVAFQFLDLTALGRDEDWSQPHPSGWVRHRDRYER
ncbi:MAG TPA: thioredoxin family protein [Steroidobacteraceae bacterium]|nr:thioredoxin family protein [Steroidobacteraceae bacterium]